MVSDRVQQYIDAGLYDPSAPTATDRLALLDYLTSLGASVDDIVAYRQPDDIAAMGIDMLLLDGELTGHELAQRGGIDWATLQEIFRLLGVRVDDPDQRLFLEDEVTLIQLMNAATQTFDGTLADEILRSMASGFSGIAETAVSAFVGNVEDDLDNVDSQVDRARVIRGTGELGVELSRVMGLLFRHHLRESVMRQRASMANVAVRQLAEFAVGFVDLAGFTQMSSEMDPVELQQFVREFDRRSYDVVTRAGGRMVKQIGDEIMFSSLSPAEACAIAIDLIAEFDEGGTKPRAGVAFGPVVARHGDYFGPVVNLAARLVDAAVPGEVLVDRNVAQPAGSAEHLSFEPAGKRMLKGFADPVEVVSVTRA